MQKFLHVIAIAVLGWLFFWLLLKETGKQIGFGINVTGSQIPGIYVYSSANGLLKKGELVDCNLDFSNPSLQWIKSRNYVSGNKKLLKNIGAIPGEWLFTAYPNIYVCAKNRLTKNCKILGGCIKKDKTGLPVFCQNWHGVRIPKNYFYLQSNRIFNSFDSRYFGLVYIKNIHHKVKIILDLS